MREEELVTLRGEKISEVFSQMVRSYDDKMKCEGILFI
jgi:hypothetical protein